MNKECNYNPLISKWNNENGYRSIIFFGSFQNNDFENVAYFEPFYLKDFMLTK